MYITMYERVLYFAGQDFIYLYSMQAPRQIIQNYYVITCGQAEPQADPQCLLTLSTSLTIVQLGCSTNVPHV
jgi:hypothetical protein